MSDSNRTSFYYLEEVSWGVTPASPLKEFELTGESLNNNIETAVSNRIRTDRQIPDLIQIGAEPGGGPDFELSYGCLDDLLEGALFSNWVGVGGGSTELITSGTTVGNLDFDLDATANEITLGSSVTHAIIPGQTFKLAGSATDDGYLKALTVVGQVIGVASITTTETLDEVDSATITGAYLKNGTTEISYSLERKHDDVTQFFSWTGMEISTLNLNVSANDIVTGAISFMGKAGVRAATTIGTGGPTAAPTTEVLNAVTNVGAITEGGTALTGVFIQDLGFEINNNLRAIPAIGTLGAADMGSGRCNITGSLSVYFANGDLYDKFLANTSTSISFKLEDAAGNAYVIDWPNIKYSSDEVNTPGVDQDVIEALNWQAIRHATYDFTMIVNRFAA